MNQSRRRPPGRPSLHPWNTYLDGKQHILVAGINFAPDLKLESMRSQVHGAARARGLEVVTRIVQPDTVIVQAVQPTNYDHLWDGRQHTVPCEGGKAPFLLQQELATAAFRAGVEVKYLARPGAVDIKAIRRLDTGEPIVPPGFQDAMQLLGKAVSAAAGQLAPPASAEESAAEAEQVEAEQVEAEQVEAEQEAMPDPFGVESPDRDEAFQG